MRHIITVILLIFSSTCASLAEVQTQKIPAPEQKSYSYKVWPSTPPSDFPVPQSNEFAGIGFTGAYSVYEKADTWYPSWASDGNMYSNFADGVVLGLEAWARAGAGYVMPKKFEGRKSENESTTGYATIIGDDPLNLKFTDAGRCWAPVGKLGGRYPCANLFYNGVWYYGTYLVTGINGNNKGWDTIDGVLYNWGTLGAFVGFRTSTDYGKTWTETSHTPDKPLFDEPNKPLGSVKIGVPHFVDFGKNMKYSPDGKAYLIAHGARDDDPMPRLGNLSWITADELYLIRVKPSVKTINDKNAYEFFAGNDKKGKAIWTNDFNKIKPLFEWNNHCGNCSMTYNPGLKKYIVCVTDGRTTAAKFNSFILESDNITGPFKLIAYLENFGPQAYFMNFPSKFISKDGRNLWLAYSANFTNIGKLTNFKGNPPGSGYGWCLREIKFLSKSDKIETSPLDSPFNVARKADISATSIAEGYNANSAIDGVVDGYTVGDLSKEWAADSNNASLKLSWDKPQTINRIWLFDRVNKFDQITGAKITFSDGTSLEVGELPNYGWVDYGGLELSFEPKIITWLNFEITKVSNTTTKPGLAEIAVFSVQNK